MFGDSEGVVIVRERCLVIKGGRGGVMIVRGFNSEGVVIERGGRCLAITREEAFGDSERFVIVRGVFGDSERVVIVRGVFGDSEGL